MKYKFDFHTAYNQFYLTSDNGEKSILTSIWSDDDFDDRLGIHENSLTLSMDKDGKVSYNKNKQKNGKFTKSDESAKQLMNAIDDHSVIFNVDADDKKTAPTGEIFVGGVFLGNNVGSDANGKTIVYLMRIFYKTMQMH